MSSARPPSIPQMDYMGVGRISTVSNTRPHSNSDATTFPCVKTNKYGMKQKRFAVIDPITATVRILDLKEKCKLFNCEIYIFLK